MRVVCVWRRCSLLGREMLHKGQEVQDRRRKATFVCRKEWTVEGGHEAAKWSCIADSVLVDRNFSVTSHPRRA